MKLATRLGAVGALMTIAGASFAPAALADTQGDKNNMRNLGILGAAVAGYGLLQHNTTATLLGAAAGGYGAYRYEQDRHRQDQEKRARERFYHRRYEYRRARHYHHRYRRTY